MRRGAWTLATLGLLGVICQAAMVIAGQARFRSGTDAVLVDVEVTSGGRPVAGLTAADFELTDSGVVQQVNVMSFADVPVSLLLVLDTSSSVDGERLARGRRKGCAAGPRQGGPGGPRHLQRPRGASGRVDVRLGRTREPEVTSRRPEPRRCPFETEPARR